MTPLWQRAAFGLLAIAAVVALVVVFSSSGDDSRPISRFPSAVVRVIPQEGQLVVRQARVGIVLEQEYKAAIVGTFGGGVNEIQREIVAAAGLRTPRVPR